MYERGDKVEKTLTFYGKGFENAVRKELQIYEGPIDLSHATNIKRLNLDGCEFLSADFETLYLFENLEDLVFEKDIGIIDFNVFTPLKKLKNLIVGGSLFSKVAFAGIDALKELPLLEYLSVSDFGDIDLAGIGEAKQLKELCVGWGNNVTNAEAIKELKNLTSLELYDVKIKSLDFLKELSDEISLDLGGLAIEEDFDVVSLKRFQNCEWKLLSRNGKFL